MNEDLLEGFVQLSDGDQRAFVLHCANRKNWAIPSGSKTGEGFDLALLPFEGAKNKGVGGMTHRSEVAMVPGAKEVKKRIANLESQAAAARRRRRQRRRLLQTGRQGRKINRWSNGKLNNFMKRI